MTEVDQIARDNAKDALARIEGHEKVCAERQAHIVSSLETLQRGVERINSRFIAGGGALIIILLGAVGTLAVILLRATH